MPTPRETLLTRFPAYTFSPPVSILAPSALFCCKTRGCRVTTSSEMKVGALGFKIDLKPIFERVWRYLNSR